MSELIAFNNEEDFRRVMRAVQFFERQYQAKLEGRPSPTSEAIYAKVTSLVSGTDDKQAKAVQVEFDGDAGDYIDISTDPWVFDSDKLDSAGTTLFDTTDITSATALVEDAVYQVFYYPNASEFSDWIAIQQGGGGAARAYVVITSVVDSENYIGNVLVSPEDPTVVETGVDIKILDAVDNPVEVSYASFADKAGDIYYLQGFILS